jgi:hypothetical protein
MRPSAGRRRVSPRSLAAAREGLPCRRADREHDARRPAPEREQLRLGQQAILAVLLRPRGHDLALLARDLEEDVLVEAQALREDVEAHDVGAAALLAGEDRGEVAGSDVDPRPRSTDHQKTADAPTSVTARARGERSRRKSTGISSRPSA